MDQKDTVVNTETPPVQPATEPQPVVNTIPEPNKSFPVISLVLIVGLIVLAVIVAYYIFLSSRSPQVINVITPTPSVMPSPTASPSPSPSMSPSPSPSISPSPSASPSPTIQITL